MPKRNTKLATAQREEIKAQVARLSRFGYPQNEIAKRVGVSEPTVSSYLKSIREQYKASNLETINASIEEAVATFRDMMGEAMMAWEKSKLDTQEKIQEVTTNAVGGSSKEVEKTKGSCGDPRFLTVAVDCYKKICDLYGIEPPKKLAVEATVSVTIWDMLSGAAPVELIDEVEERMLKVLGNVEAKDAPPPAPDGSPGEKKDE